MESLNLVKIGAGNISFLPVKHLPTKFIDTSLRCVEDGSNNVDQDCCAVSK